MMEFAKVNGTMLHYARDGAAAGVPMLFINSLGTDLRIWEALLSHFTDFPLIRYDKRGHGLSDCPPAPYSIRDHAQDLAALMETLELSQVILVGISVGGMIALDFVANWPGRVRALVLSDTAPRIGTPQMWDERIGLLREQGMVHLGQAILSRWFVPEFAGSSPAAYRGYLNMLVRTPLEGYIGTCEAIRDADLTPVLGDIRVPSLVLCGAADLATPPELTRRMAEMLPDAVFQEIPAAAHLPCVEQPDQMAALISRFVAEKLVGSET